MTRWAVGVEESDGMVRLVALHRHRGRIEWVDRLEVPIHSATPEQFQDWLRLYEKAIWVGGLESRQLLIRPLEIALKRRKELETAFPLQLEALLPCPIEQLVVEKEIGKARDETTPITALAAPRTTISQLRERLATLLGESWEPDQIGCEPIGLRELCHWADLDLSSLLILRRSRQGACLVLVHEGMVRAVHPTPETDADSIMQETYRFQQACAQRWRLPLPEQILLLCDDPVVAKPLLANLPTVTLPDAPEGIVTYSGALGLALGALRGRVNFARGEFAHSKPWVRLKRPLRSLIVALVVLLLAMLGLGLSLVHHRAAGVRAGYAALLKAAPQSESLSSQLALPKSLSLEDYEKRMGLLEIALAKSSAYPLAADVPGVRHLVDWLNRQPELSGRPPRVRLEKLHYSLAQRPEAGKPYVSYRVKVALELSSTDAGAARLLQERLQGAGTLVDRQSEFTWQGGAGGKYSVSFYLKPLEVQP